MIVSPSHREWKAKQTRQFDILPISTSYFSGYYQNTHKNTMVQPLSSGKQDDNKTIAITFKLVKDEDEEVSVLITVELRIEYGSSKD